MAGGGGGPPPHSQVLSPTTIFFRYAGNLSLPPLPPLFPPPPLLLYFPCMDSFSSFLRCCLLLCSVWAPFSFYGPRRRRRQKKRGSPPLPFSSSSFFLFCPTSMSPAFSFLEFVPDFFIPHTTTKKLWEKLAKISGISHIRDAGALVSQEWGRDEGRKGEKVIPHEPTSLYCPFTSVPKKTRKIKIFFKYP